MAIRPDDYLVVGRGDTSYYVKFEDSGITQNANYVLKTGDTMTGPLSFEGNTTDTFSRIRSVRYDTTVSEEYGLILDLTDGNTYRHSFKVLTRADHEALKLYDDGTPRFTINGALRVNAFGDKANSTLEIFDESNTQAFRVGRTGVIYSKGINFNKGGADFFKLYTGDGNTTTNRVYRFSNSETRWEVKNDQALKFVGNDSQVIKLSTGADSTSDPQLRLHYLVDPIGEGDAVNLRTLESKVGEYLPLSGGVLTGNVSGNMQFKSTRSTGNCFEVKPDNVTVRCALTNSGRIDITMGTRTSAAIRTIGSINVKAPGQGIGDGNSFIAHQDYVRNYTDVSDAKDCATKEYVDAQVAAGGGANVEYVITKTGNTYYVS